MSVCGILACSLLLLTPGAWITFGLSLRRIPFSGRLFTGAVLSPLVVGAEFYALRLMGVAFGPTAIALVLINLPALYLIWRHAPKVWVLTRGACIVGLVVVALCVGVMAKYPV